MTGQRATPPPLRLSAAVVRGGTHHGLLVRRAMLPADPAEWPPLLLAALDQARAGAAGADHSATPPRVAVIRPGAVPEADVDCLVATAVPGVPRLDAALPAGDLAAAVALFAVEARWVLPALGGTVVRVREPAHERLTEVIVPTSRDGALRSGRYTVDGVAGTGPRIDLRFLHAAGAATGALLPTGRPQDTLTVPGVGACRVTLLDAVLPVVLIPTATLGVDAQAPDALHRDEALRTRLAALRDAAAPAMGLATPGPFLPVPLLLAPAVREDCALSVLPVLAGRAHAVLDAAGAVAAGVGALLDGTVAHEMRRHTGPARALRLAHPAGTVAAGVELRTRDGVTMVFTAEVGCTATVAAERSLAVDPARVAALVAERSRLGLSQELPAF